MSPDQLEEMRHQLCSKTAKELMEASRECASTWGEYARRAMRRRLTLLEEMEMANVEDLQDLINDARDALATMREEVPFAIAPRAAAR
jgi:hypothetical protein